MQLYVLFTEKRKGRIARCDRGATKMHSVHVPESRVRVLYLLFYRDRAKDAHSRLVSTDTWSVTGPADTRDTASPTRGEPVEGIECQRDQDANTKCSMS